MAIILLIIISRFKALKIKQEMKLADSESHRTDLVGKQSRQCGFLGGNLCCSTAAAGVVLLQLCVLLGKSKKKCTHSLVLRAQLPAVSKFLLRFAIGCLLLGAV